MDEEIAYRKPPPELPKPTTLPPGSSLSLVQVYS